MSNLASSLGGQSQAGQMAKMNQVETTVREGQRAPGCPNLGGPVSQVITTENHPAGQTGHDSPPAPHEASNCSPVTAAVPSSRTARPAAWLASVAAITGACPAAKASVATATTVLGVIPLLQDVFWVGLAVTIMAGLTFGTMLTMVMVPVFYAVVFGVKVEEKQ